MRSIAIILLLTLCIPVWSFSDEERAKREFKFAYGIYREGLYEEAADQFKGIVSHYPEFKKNDYVRYLIAESLYQLKNFEEASTHYKRLIEDYPKSVLRLNSMISNAWSNYHLKKYADAHGILNNAINEYRESPTIADAYQFQGDIYLIEKEYLKAAEMFEEFLKRFEKNQETVMFKSGSAFFEGGEYSKAVWRLKEMVKLFPQTENITQGYARIAQASYQLGDYEQSSEFCDKIIEMDKNPETYPAIFFKALSSFQKENYKKSLEGFEKLLKDNKEHQIPGDEILYRSGKCSYNLGDFKKSRNYFTRLIQENSESSFCQEAKYFVGITYLREGNQKKVRESFEDYVKTSQKKEDQEKAVFMIASSYYAEENFAEAQKKFREFSEKYPESIQDGQAKFLCAESSYNLGKYDEALTKHQEITGTDKYKEFHTKSYFAIGEIYYLKKDYEKAIIAFDRVETEKESSLASDTLKRLGDCYYQLKKDEKALTYYEKIAKSTSRDSLGMEMNFRVARIHYEKKRYVEARDGFKYVLKKAPEEYREDIYFYLAQSEKYLKNYAKAIETYQKIVKSGKIKDLVLKSLKGIGYCNFSRKEYTKAIESYKQMVDTFKGGEMVAEAQYWIGKSYLMMNDPKNALLEFLKVTILFPEYKYTPHSYIKIGELYEKLGNKIKARQTYEKFLTQFKDSKDSERVSKKLKELL